MIECLQQTIDYIEENLRKPISIDDCAYVAGFSKYHFHRLFGLYVGTSLMEYIRRRRLSYAMLDVLHGRRILDIAIEYGYSSERSFTRAFQQQFGQVPSRCRKAKYQLPAKPVLTATPKLLHGGILMNYLSEARMTVLTA